VTTTICPMLSALKPIDEKGQPVNRECIFEQCRFFNLDQKDCNLMIGHRAVERLETSLRLGPDVQAAVLQAGQAADRVGSLESTVNGLGAALARLETQIAAIIEVQQKVADRLLEEMSLLLARTQKNDQSIAAFTTRLENAESTTRDVLEALRTQAQKDEAILREKRHDESVACNNRGVALYYRGAFEAARDAFLKALELQPEYAEAFNNLGLVHSRLGNETEAIEAFRKALESDPKMGEAYNNLGFLYHTSSQFDRAAQMFGQAIENAGDSAVAYTNLGNTYYAMHQSEKAIAAWTRAVELDPMNESARRGLRMFQQDGTVN
jgi:tetratricopeptide (TPR) repeat protein